MSEVWEEGVTERNIRAGLTIRSDVHIGKCCLFCREPEKRYKPDKGIEFVCGNCVILLSGADQEELKTAYKKATEVKSLDQARALESFIEEEGNHGPKKPKVKIKHDRRPVDRGRNVKPARCKKERFGKT